MSEAPSLQFKPSAEQLITVNVMDVIAFEHNPRKAPNPNYFVIKESIRRKLIEHPVTVTRRPGDGRFVLARGGSTRLSCIQELWLETGDSKYSTMSVHFVKYESELSLLLAHIRENVERGDTCFWDDMNAAFKVRAMLMESLHLEELPPKQYLELVEGAISKTQYFLFLFAFTRLTELGDLGRYVTLTAVKDHIQPRLNALARLAVLYGQSEEDFWASNHLIVHGFVQSNNSGSFNVQTFCEYCEDAVRERFDLDPRSYSRCLAIMRETPPDSLEALRSLMVERQTSRRSHQNARRQRNSRSDPAETVAAVAEEMGLEQALVIDPGTPRGFYLHAPNPQLLGNSFVMGGWWLLAMLSGQLAPEFLGSLPPDDPWALWLQRSLGRVEAGDPKRDSKAVATVVGPVPSLADVGEFLLNYPSVVKLITSLGTTEGLVPPDESAAMVKTPDCGVPA